jgi:hypothetical protein
MLKSIIWTNPKPLKDLEHIKLPPSFQFITDFNEDVLCAIGLTSTYVNITWIELKEVNEGFSF